MFKKRILLIGVVILLTSSCSKYLEVYPNGDRTEEDIWKYQNMVQGLIGQCYDYIPSNYNDNEGAYFDGVTDNAVLTSSVHPLKRLVQGEMTTGNDAFQTYWTRDYRAIRLLNIFLKDRRGYNTKFIINQHWNDLVKNRLQGEAFGLRAWFEWDLLQKFGGRSVDGKMLGFPIVTEPLDDNGNINLARNTYDECIAQILNDCDSAYKYLPIAHRDFLVPKIEDRVYAGGKYWGRIDGITTRAIKAQVYLTWASPRFNTNNDKTRWDKAAKYAYEVIRFKLDQDGAQSKGFKPADALSWFNPNFPGIVWSSRYNNANDDMERMFYPGGFQGDGAIGASQNLVDAFPMKNGFPISDPRSGYNAAEPYKDRDPRFYSIIWYNTALAKKNNTGAVMYTFENQDGGKDAAGENAKNSRTNYHVKKMVFMGLNWSDASVNRQPHMKIFFRWDDMILTFAEAANHVNGPLNAAYGISPKDAVKYLRTRKTYDGASMWSADPYLDEVAAAGENAFDALVKNEIRIETCFEGTWFYHVRRWSTSLSDLNKPVYGVKIIKNSDGSYTYNFRYEVERPAYKSAYLPIPYSEMLRMSKLVQNEGWDAWK